MDIVGRHDFCPRLVAVAIANVTNSSGWIGAATPTSGAGTLARRLSAPHCRRWRLRARRRTVPAAGVTIVTIVAVVDVIDVDVAASAAVRSNDHIALVALIVCVRGDAASWEAAITSIDWITAVPLRFSLRGAKHIHSPLDTAVVTVSWHSSHGQRGGCATWRATHALTCNWLFIAHGRPGGGHKRAGRPRPRSACPDNARSAHGAGGAHDRHAHGVPISASRASAPRAASYIPRDPSPAAALAGGYARAARRASSLPSRAPRRRAKHRRQVVFSVVGHGVGPGRVVARSAVATG